MNSQRESLGFLMVDVTRLLRRAFKQRLEGSDLTLAQARALVYIFHQEGVRQVELADQLEVQPITLARLIDQLEEMELVVRKPDPTDRRAHLIYLTEAAQPHLDAIEDVSAAIRKDATRDFSEQEITVLMSALQKIRSRLSSQ
jgi:DNA-binding MarR family transcriptional regulator